MTEFHFLRPGWLLALPLVGWLAWEIMRSSAVAARWRQVIDPLLLPWLVDESGGRAARSAGLLVLAGWLLAVLALAGPAWEKLPSPVQRKLDLQIVLFDLSASMYAEDVRPSRLQRARHKLGDLLDQRREGQTALIAYAGDAFTVTPFTDDRATVLNLVRSLDPALMPAQGSRLMTALREVDVLLQEQPAQPVRLLLVTDEVRSGELQSAADWLRERDLPLDILAVGTPAGAPIPLPGGDFARDASGRLVTPGVNVAALRDLATTSGGIFQQLRADNRDLQALLVSSTAWDSAVEDAGGREADRYRDAGVWLLLPLLPLAALGFRRGWLGVLALLCLFPPQPAMALDWRDLWRTPDQQGHAAFHQGDYEQAGRAFEDTEWRAAAQYRAGDMEAAAETLAGRDSARAHYNRGNALAQANRLQEAIEAYQQALALDSDDEDAQFNKKLLEDLLQQRQQAQDPQAASGSSDDAQQRQQSGQSGESANDPSQAEQSRQGDADAEPEASDPQDAADAQAENPRQEPAAQQQPDPARTADAEPQDGGPEVDSAARRPPADPEADQAMEQWLRKIPDDPSALLRRKFLWQYQRRGAPHDDTEEQPW